MCCKGIVTRKPKPYMQNPGARGAGGGGGECVVCAGEGGHLRGRGVVPDGRQHGACAACVAGAGPGAAGA